MKRILTIAGSDSGGGAGIQADLKTITLLGGFGMSAITALTAQNTVGVQGIVELDPEFVKKQIDSVLSDIGADAIKTGMLANSEIVRGVAEKIKQYGIDKVVVDPVMVAKSGDALLKKEAQDAVKGELLPLCYLVTPNLPEASVLSGHEVKGLDDMKRAAMVIHQLGARNVLVKGGHLTGNPIDLLFDGERFHEFTGERIQTKNTHGTGCTYAAAIATELAKGNPLEEAIIGKGLFDRCPPIFPESRKGSWSDKPLCNGFPGNRAVSSYRGAEEWPFPASEGQSGQTHTGGPIESGVCPSAWGGEGRYCRFPRKDNSD